MIRCLVLLVLLVLTIIYCESDIPELRITQHPVGGAVPVGDRFDFECRAETSSGKSMEYSWAKIADIGSLNPELEVLTTVDTGSEGVYIEYNAQDSAFYFCIVTSDSFQTTSNGAYLAVAYLDDFAADGGPTSQTYADSLLYIELQCLVPNSNPYPNVQWYKYGVKYAAENAVLYRDSVGQASKLIIFDLTVDDSGTYYCEVENEGADTTYQSTSAYIEIEPDAVTVGEYSPQVIVTNYEVQGQEHHQITLYAGVASRPKADYEWTINSEVILSEGRFSLEDYDRSLVIRELEGSDEGTYLVSYKQNGISMGAINIVLTVVMSVRAEGDVFDYSTVSGEDLVLDCGCAGSPPDWILFDTDTPGTQWFKDGTLLQNSSDTEVYTTVNGKQTGKALVKSVSSPESGTYCCSCFNQAEYMSFTKNIFIADERRALTITADSEGWGLVGTTISVACTAQGTPRPIIDWYKGGSKVVEGVFPRDTGFRIEYVKSMFTTIGYLVVEEAEHLDSGVFECKASHSVRGVEYNVTTTAKLTVAIATSSRIQCLNTTVEEGSTATLVCGVSGVPLPTVTYTKVNQTDDSLILLSEDFGEVSNTSYFIIPDVGMEDAGIYRGYATNIATGGFLSRFDTLHLTVTETSSRMSMNMIIGLSVLVAFVLMGSLILIILIGRWRREKEFKQEMKRLIREREEEVSEMQDRLQLRSMQHRAPSLGNPLHQLPETRRQLPSFYTSNIAILAAAPSAKFLPPSLAHLKKRRLTGSVIHEQVHVLEPGTVSPSSVKTTLSDVEHPDTENLLD